LLQRIPVTSFLQYKTQASEKVIRLIEDHLSCTIDVWLHFAYSTVMARLQTAARSAPSQMETVWHPLTWVSPLTTFAPTL
jgi:hypothetical protein